MKMKKLVCALLVGAMVMGMSMVASAAPGITAEEQAILDQAKAKAAELGLSTSGAEFSKYYSQAETYLTSNEVTAEQAKDLVAAVDTAATTAKAEMDKQGVKSLAELKNTDVLTTLKSTVATQVKDATTAIGINISVDAKGNVKVTDKDGAVIFETGKVVEQTGTSMTAPVVVAVVLVGAVAATVVVASKKRLAEEA